MFISFVLQPETKPVGLCRDPSSQCIWVFGEGTIVNYRPDNEARSIFPLIHGPFTRVCLQGCLAEFGREAGVRGGPEDHSFDGRPAALPVRDQEGGRKVLQQTRVRLSPLSFHLSLASRFCAAAEILAESVEPFENIVLRFLKASSNESRNGLKRFLELKLNAVQHTVRLFHTSLIYRPLKNRVQRDILVIWLFEIQLSELAELRRQVLHGDRETLTNPKGGNLAHQSGQLEKLRNELEIFLNRSSVLDCVRDNRAAVYRLITTHADFNTQLYLAEKLKGWFALSVLSMHPCSDYDVMIKIYLLQGDYKNALRTATSHTNAAIFYKYAKDFFEHTPVEFVKSLIELERALKPGMIVSSMANCLNDSQKVCLMFGHTSLVSLSS